MKTAFEALAGLTGAELVALARSTREASPPVSTPSPAIVRAVSDPNGRAWRVEGPGWTMAPIGMPARNLNAAIDFLARVTTGFWPEMSARSFTAASIALAFWIDSPSPMLITTLTNLGTCITLSY